VLKALAEICEPDARYQNMVVGNPPFDIRFMTLEDHHGFIARIQIEDHVPARIRTAFERARNAFLYAWFVYDLTPLAQAQGYAALEMALRDRLGPRPDGKKWRGLADLMQAARKQQLFDGAPLPATTAAERVQLLDAILAMARYLRNELAHGSEHLSIPGGALDTLEHCALLINHIFPRTTTP